MRRIKKIERNPTLENTYKVQNLGTQRDQIIPYQALKSPLKFIAFIYFPFFYNHCPHILVFIIIFSQ